MGCVQPLFQLFVYFFIHHGWDAGVYDIGL